MNDLEKCALLKTLPLLAEKMQRIEVITYLIGKYIFTFLIGQQIERKETDHEKNRYLIELLIKSNRPDAFELFIEALNQFNQECLAKEILNALKNLREKKENNKHISELSTYQKVLRIVESCYCLKCSQTERCGEISADLGGSESFSTAQHLGGSESFSTAQSLTTSSQLNQLRTISERSNLVTSALKTFYKNSFQKVNPFSLPFTFDIQNTWVPLTLTKSWAEPGQNTGHEQKMESHLQLVEQAFMEGKQLLVIESRAASGKTSLMRRIAYDWANGKLCWYTYVFYVEFRNLKKQEFSTIVELIQGGFQHMQDDNIDKLSSEMKNRNFWKGVRILVLLDGFDEAQVKIPCAELSDFFKQRGLNKLLLFHVIISTRPGPLSKHLSRHDILNSANIIGFEKSEQKLDYIRAHFHSTNDCERKICEVEQCLNVSWDLNKIAETPMLLVFICLVHDKMKKKTVFELYKCMIWWLIDRYQASHPMLNVPRLFGFETDANNDENYTIIQCHFLEFPQLRNLGIMAFESFDKSIFSKADIVKHEIDEVIINVGILRREENYVDLRVATQFTFPHRTIQEFLAGGLYYFWPERIAVNDNLTKNTFYADISFEHGPEVDEKKKYMNGLEVFFWRAAFSLEDIICSRLEVYFQKYESLTLDLSLIFMQPDSVIVLNKILRKCYNLKKIRFYCSSEKTVFQVDGIDLSGMKFLQTLGFNGVLVVGKRECVPFLRCSSILKTVFVV